MDPAAAVVAGSEQRQVREKWSSRPAFIFAAVGSAIGLGNVWRFPALCYQYGGGAFFLPYILALIFVGIPVLLLEVALGQYYQAGDAVCFGQMHRRLRGVGLGSLWCGFSVTCYYTMLLGWAVRMFFLSFGDSPFVNPDKATMTFLQDVTGMKGIGETGWNSHPTEVIPENIPCLFFVWLVVFLCLAFGIKNTGRLTYVTVLLPTVLMLIILFRAVSLDGSDDGVKAYIGEWDMKVLREMPDVWSKAVTQIFFSLSVTFGIMTAYASYNKRQQWAITDTMVIAVSNSLFSFISGFAVFASLGYLAHKTNTTVDSVPFVNGGPLLMFVTLPVTLHTLPGGGHWERLLFVMVFLLGIDSAFSLIEGVVTAIRDVAGCERTPRWIQVGCVCVVGFLIGLVYCSDAGLAFLDVADHYINFVMLIVGFFETASAGWVFGFERQVQRLGWLAPTLLAASTVVSVVLMCIVAWAPTYDKEGEGAGFGILAWFLCHAIGCGLSVGAMKAERNAQNIYELFLGNVTELRDMLSRVVGPIPLVWAVLIKHLLPSVMIILIVNLLETKSPSDRSVFGDYEGYDPLYQTFGVVLSLIGLAVVLFGIAMPHDLEPLTRVKELEEADKTPGQQQPQQQPYQPPQHQQAPAQSL